MDYKTFIEMDIPRIHCPKCGITTVALPWARPFSGMTTDLEARINALATTTNITNVHKLTGISPNRVTRTIIHYVEAARKQSDMSKVQAVGVDETSES
jgi:transposase